MCSRLFDLQINTDRFLKRAFLGAFFLAGFLSGCATPLQTLELRQNPPDISQHRELTNVPFFPQTEYHCGPAALATTIQYRHVAALPDDISPLVYTPGLKGALQIEMVAATRQFGLLPVKHDGRLSSLLREIDAGNPVLVLQNLGLDAYPFWHYAVVVGYDLESQTVVLRSGTTRRLVRPFDNFERTWQRAGFWGLIIVPANQIPATSTSDTYINSIIELEQTGRLKIAHQAYRLAAKRWPDSQIAFMGIGNTAFGLGNFADSALAYQQLLKIAPKLDEAWNNLAYALAKQGKKQPALTAINTALELAPDNKNYQDSLEELKQLLDVE